MGDGADGCEHKTPAKSAEIVRNRSIMLATSTAPCVVQERGSAGVLGRKATPGTLATKGGAFWSHVRQLPRR